MTDFPTLSNARLSVPRMSARVSAAESASVLARLIASGAADTQADIVRATGLARSTVGTGLDALALIGVVDTDGLRYPSGRGRPGERLRINPSYGVIAAVELNLASATLVLYDFGQHELARAELALSLLTDPADTVARLAEDILRRVGELRPRLPLRTAVIGVAAMVDVKSGNVVGPPMVADWDQFPLASTLAESLGCTVLVRNEVDLRALGDARSLPPSESPLLYLRVGDGIGSGYVDAGGDMVSGVDGAAGEISHMRTSSREGRLCMCGVPDHLHAYGSEWAMTAQWQQSAESRSNDSRDDLERALRRRDLDAVRIAIEAAREIGAVLAEMILMLNPARISVGGRLLDASDVILSTIRAVVYDTGLPLATRNLSIAKAVLGEESGIRGGLVLALENELSAQQLGEHLLTARPQRR